jgi:hypothetical protein
MEKMRKQEEQKVEKKLKRSVHCLNFKKIKLSTDSVLNLNFIKRVLKKELPLISFHRKIATELQSTPGLNQKE